MEAILLSLKAKRAVATRYGRLADEATDAADAKRYRKLEKDTLAEVAKLERKRVGKKVAAATLSAIALRAQITRIANKAKATRGKARAELLAQIPGIEARIAELSA